MKTVAVLLAAAPLFLAFLPPGNEKFAVRGSNGAAILPGGRVIQPAGEQIPTGPGPFVIRVSPSGNIVATANLGPERASITLAAPDRRNVWTVHNVFAELPHSGDSDFRSVFSIAFAGEKRLWISEGDSGRIRLIDIATGATKKRLTLDRPLNTASFSGDLALDSVRSVLHVLDPLHSRLVVIDTEIGEQIASISLAFIPHFLAFSPDNSRVWITGAGDNGRASSVDVSDPRKPRVLVTLNTGGSRIAATRDSIYVADARNDSIDVIDPAANVIKSTIALRIPGWENYLGISPAGMAFDPVRERLYVAETGINAVAVIATRQNRVLGHIPAGWYPASVALRKGEILVANAKGSGSGPSSVLVQLDSFDFAGVFHRGTVSRIPEPSDSELAKQTHLVLAANGMLPGGTVPDRRLPVRYVVLIVKGDRSFDEIFGGLKLPDWKIEGSARLARFGSEGYADGGKGRFSFHGINITPNQQALAERFAISDNFYTDGDSPAEGRRWLFGPYPNVWTESLLLSGDHTPALMPANGDDGNLENYFERHEVAARSFDQAAGSDQARAARFIQEIETKYSHPGEDLPRLLVLHLPTDTAGDPRPKDGYPYEASYEADSDLAVGRTIEYLSHTRWWPEMAVFVTQIAADAGRDHVDAHRTVFLAIGPYIKNGFVSHLNANFASLRRLIFELLSVPAQNLFDATASDLREILTSDPNPKPFNALGVDSHILDRPVASAPTTH